MNQAQKKILLISASVVVLMTLFPPYVVKNYKHMVIQSGYGFIFDLPPYISETSSAVVPATMNIPTLLMQIFAVIVVTALICIANKK